MDHSPAFLKLCEDARKRIKETTIVELKKRLDQGEKLILVDVREDGEWGKGRIPGAVHMGRGVIERDIESKVPDKKTEILLYCGGGFRSALTAESLQKMGYTGVVSVNGGWRGWVAAGFPIEK